MTGSSHLPRCPNGPVARHTLLRRHHLLALHHYSAVNIADQSQPGIDPDDYAQMLGRRDYGYGRYGGGSSGGILVGNEAVVGSFNRITVKVGVMAQLKLVPPK